MTGYHYVVTQPPVLTREDGRHRCHAEVLVFRATGDSPASVARIFAASDSAFDRGEAIGRAMSRAHGDAVAWAQERNR